LACGCRIAGGRAAQPTRQRIHQCLETRGVGGRIDEPSTRDGILGVPAPHGTAAAAAEFWRGRGRGRGLLGWARPAAYWWW
jgi:hypothetical protein